jgi:subtilisin family serine protease
MHVPSVNEIVTKKEAAAIHPTEKYFLGQVQLRLADDQDLEGVVSSVSNRGVSLRLLDKIPYQPVYLMEIEGTTPVDEAVAELKRDQRVVAASPSFLIEAKSFPERQSFKTNDPLLRDQWGMMNSGQEAPASLAGIREADIHMGGVDTEGSKDVVVAIIDTGLDYLHEDLAVVEKVSGRVVVTPESNIWINPGEIPGDNINNDNNGDPRVGWTFVDDVHGYNFVHRNGDPMDDHGHGTHVAGVIGALRNNHKGIAGMNSKVSLMGLKFLSAEGGGSDFDAQMALYYLMDLQKRFPDKKFITSNSWGASGRSTRDGDNDDFLLMAFAEADRAGILHIVAAGNSAMSTRYAEFFPSNYSNKIMSLISVAATNNRDQLASFTNYGYGLVQVAAPGVQILSTVPARLFRTPYESWSGTSMATPHVSGLAALIWAQNPEMTNIEVKERIINTVDVLPQLAGSVTTSGRINVRRALSGDLNVRLPEIDQEELIPWVVESPRGDDRNSFDWLNEITVDGARQIQVCFSRIDLVNDSDWLEVLDETYRVRDLITGNYRNRNYLNQSREVCTAPVLGDTVFLRLWNAGMFTSFGFTVDASMPGLQGYETAYLKVVR